MTPIPTSAERFAQICDSASQAVTSVAQLHELPTYWRAALAPMPDGGTVTHRFWLIVVVGLVAAPFITWGMQRLFDPIIGRARQPDSR